MKTINIVVIRRGTAKEGMLKLRVTEGGDSKYKTLGIKIPITYWNKEKSRVKATDKIDYKAINEKIEEVEKEYRNADNASEKLQADKTSFISFYRELIPEIRSVGSKKKYRSQLSVLIDYLLTIGKHDLRFSEIDKTFVLKFREYLSNERQLSSNTVVRYLKHFKTIINKAIKAEVYAYLRHPFLNISLEKETSIDKYLTKEEFQKLIDFTPASQMLCDVRLKFLFSIMCCGLRTSDLHLLTYSAIRSERITYIMYKTKQKLSIKLNENLKLLLAEILITTDEAQTMNGYMGFRSAYDAYHSYLIELRSNMPATINEELLRKWKKINPTLDIESRIEKQNEYKNDQHLKYLKHKLTESVTPLLRGLSVKHPKLFVFKGLDQIVFKNFDVFDPTTKQHSQIESKTTLYNRALKELQKALGFDLNLTSHVARHTYTNLMIEIGTDIYAISKSLNHQNLTTTQSYVAKFNDKVVDNAVDILSDAFPL